MLVPGALLILQSGHMLDQAILVSKFVTSALLSFFTTQWHCARLANRAAQLLLRVNISLQYGPDHREDVIVHFALPSGMSVIGCWHVAPATILAICKGLGVAPATILAICRGLGVAPATFMAICRGLGQLDAPRCDNILVRQCSRIRIISAVLGVVFHKCESEILHLVVVVERLNEHSEFRTRGLILSNNPLGDTTTTEVVHAGHSACRLMQQLLANGAREIHRNPILLLRFLLVSLLLRRVLVLVLLLLLLVLVNPK
jgi:hypothetical protein